MTVSYFDKIMYLYPGIQGIMQWYTNQNGDPLPNPYMGIEWSNTIINKPSQEALDALDDITVQTELNRRLSETVKAAFLDTLLTDLTQKAAYLNYKAANPSTTPSSYYDYINSATL